MEQIGKLAMNNNSWMNTSSEKVKNCPHCGAEIRYFYVDFLGKEVPIACECRIRAREEKDREMAASNRRLRIAELFDISEMGDRFRGCTFENFIVRPGTEGSFKAARDYVQYFNKNDPHGLIFYGIKGNGKTHLIAAIINHLLQHDVTCIFQVVPTLLSRYRAIYNGSGENEMTLTNRLISANLLVLDDVGAENTTEWTQSRLFEIIDGRYSKNRPTIFTSNVDGKELSKRIGERSVNRIIETCDWIENKGTSYRIEIAKKRLKERED